MGEGSQPKVIDTEEIDLSLGNGFVFELDPARTSSHFTAATDSGEVTLLRPMHNDLATGRPGFARLLQPIGLQLLSPAFAEQSNLFCVLRCGSADNLKVFRTGLIGRSGDLLGSPGDRRISSKGEVQEQEGHEGVPREGHFGECHR